MLSKYSNLVKRNKNKSLKPLGTPSRGPQRLKRAKLTLVRVEMTKIMMFCCFCSIDITGLNLMSRYGHLVGAPRNLMQGALRA